jgi:hypothetical protein
MNKALWVKLMTVTAITVIPRWRTWNQVRMFFVGLVDFLSADQCMTHDHVYTNEEVEFRTDMK